MNGCRWCEQLSEESGRVRRCSWCDPTDPTTYPQISKHRRRHTLRHALADGPLGWACCYCGTPVECASCVKGTKIPATMDHVVPKARGGRLTRRNAVLSCGPCNAAKGCDTPDAALLANTG